MNQWLRDVIILHIIHFQKTNPSIKTLETINEKKKSFLKNLVKDLEFVNELEKAFASRFVQEGNIRTNDMIE